MLGPAVLRSCGPAPLTDGVGAALDTSVPAQPLTENDKACRVCLASQGSRRT
ncbi:hypothetical protein KUF71_010228 [Frankliniella fusca]|uniref:Uncharacterized protein n=1 Tax=Frankliniella fusca TaxID=407009 RepID=A0AAE1HGZ2_9NEOP|nr:hypothetical protein KUF71_010228 [Frankliniella fusca]